MELQKKQRFNDSNREDILSYLESGGAESGIELTPKQEQLLERYKYADELIRLNKYKREQIANMIMAKFDLSRDTAYKDIVNAEYIFSSSYPLNKRYIIGLRIEFLQRKIRAAYALSDFAAAASLERVLQNYIADYPDFLPPRAPKQIVLNVQNNILHTDMTAEQAFELSANIAKRLEEQDDY